MLVQVQVNAVRRAILTSDVKALTMHVIFKDICELNNRTKEARPEDFVKDEGRYHVTKAPKRGKDSIITRHIICKKRT